MADRLALTSIISPPAKPNRWQSVKAHACLLARPHEVRSLCGGAHLMGAIVRFGVVSSNGALSVAERERSTLPTGQGEAEAP